METKNIFLTSRFDMNISFIFLKLAAPSTFHFTGLIKFMLIEIYKFLIPFFGYNGFHSNHFHLAVLGNTPKKSLATDTVSSNLGKCISHGVRNAHV